MATAAFEVNEMLAQIARANSALVANSLASPVKPAGEISLEKSSRKRNWSKEYGSKHIANASTPALSASASS
jgi:hypothetical protein